jgi:GDP-D-mannose dehydratase
VHGMKRCSSSFKTDRVEYMYQDPKANYKMLALHYGNLSMLGWKYKVGLTEVLTKPYDWYLEKKT